MAIPQTLGCKKHVKLLQYLLYVYSLSFFPVLEPVSRHMEEQGLEFLQFAFRWFNCLLIREVCI